jgi:threonylcarbamoyladenosine tRNA methylthiotransferase MtaB
MRRGYRPEEAMSAIENLHNLRGDDGALRDPFLACDVITGFPGETPERFEETFAFCKKADFAWIHAFPFSRRPGTEAWDFRDRVSERDAGERVRRLLELARQGKAAYTSRWLGREVEAVAESGEGELAAANGPPIYGCHALSSNYLKLFVPRGPDGERPKAGSIIRAKLTPAPEDSGFDAVAGRLE